MDEQKLFYPSHSRFGYTSRAHRESRFQYHAVNDTAWVGCLLCRCWGLVKLIASQSSIRQAGVMWERCCLFGFFYYTAHGPVGKKNPLQALLVFFLEKQHPVIALLSLLVSCMYLNWIMYLCLIGSDFLTKAREHKLLHYTFALISFIEERTLCIFFED